MPKLPEEFVIVRKNGTLQALCSLLMAAGLLGACLQPAGDAGPAAGTAARAIDADGVYEVAVLDDDEASFWDFSNLDGVMSTAPGVSAWSSSRIDTARMNASGLAPFDVLVITGWDRSFVTAQVQADIHAWVTAGGVLIIASGTMFNGHDPLLGEFGCRSGALIAESSCRFRRTRHCSRESPKRRSS